MSSLPTYVIPLCAANRVATFCHSENVSGPRVSQQGSSAPVARRLYHPFHSSYSRSIIIHFTLLTLVPAFTTPSSKHKSREQGKKRQHATNHPPTRPLHPHINLPDHSFKPSNHLAFTSKCLFTTIDFSLARHTLHLPNHRVHRSSPAHDHKRVRPPRSTNNAGSSSS